MSDHEDTDPGDESWDSNEEDEDDDGGFADYYSFNEDDQEGRASQFNNNDDPEYFAYECLTVANVEKIFNDSIETVKAGLNVSHARAKQILHANKWNIPEVMAKFTPRVASPTRPMASGLASASVETQQCSVCVLDLPMSQLTSLKSCGHTFCVQCWGVHCETQISTGVTTSLGCMMAG